MGRTYSWVMLVLSILSVCVVASAAALKLIIIAGAVCDVLRYFDQPSSLQIILVAMSVVWTSPKTYELLLLGLVNFIAGVASLLVILSGLYKETF